MVQMQGQGPNYKAILLRLNKPLVNHNADLAQLKNSLIPPYKEDKLFIYQQLFIVLM